MAALRLARNFAVLTRNSVLPRITVSPRHYSDKGSPYYEPSEGKIASDDIEMPDAAGGAVGIERWELIQKAKGNKDPFMLDGLQNLTPGTKEKPTIIPSCADTRTVGCLCEPDAASIRWTRLYQGETKRCMCGHFFKLVQVTDEA